jgi:hypothetical protein
VTERYEETLSQVLNTAVDILHGKAEANNQSTPSKWHYQSGTTFFAMVESEILRLKAAYEDKKESPDNVEHSSRIVGHALNAALELIKFSYVEGDL